MRVQFVRLFEIRFSLLVLRKLHQQDSPRNIKFICVFLKRKAVGNHVHANLKGLMGKTNVGKVEIQAGISWIQKERLSERAYRMRRIAAVFKSERRQLQSLGAWTWTIEQRF